MWGELRRVLVRPLPRTRPLGGVRLARGARSRRAARPSTRRSRAARGRGRRGRRRRADRAIPTRSTPTTRPRRRSGAVLLRPGKEGRRASRRRPSRRLEGAGVPVAATLEAPATVEGGDTLWLDERRSSSGRLPHEPRRRSRAAGRVSRRRGDRLRPAALARRGRGDAPDEPDLAARPRPRPRLPAHRAGAASSCSPSAGSSSSRFRTRSSRRWARTCSRSARGGRSRSKETRDAPPDGADGVDVAVYRGDEISRKGDGGPTCLTRPLLRI